jgi:hypothetical protein
MISGSAALAALTMDGPDAASSPDNMMAVMQIPVFLNNSIRLNCFAFP